MSVGGLAGCTNAESGGSGGGLRAVSAEGNFGFTGEAHVTVTIENTASESQGADLVVEVTLDGSESYTETQYVRVPAGSSETVEVTVDIPAFDTYTSDDASLDVWFD